MDTALLFAGLLLLLLAAGLVYFSGSALIPSVVVPCACLSEEEQKRLWRRKLVWRGCALAFFALAAASLFSPFPRGVALSAALAGFCCQYAVFRLRRRYPAQDPRR